MAKISFVTNAEPDVPDTRDLIYEPPLIPLKKEVAAPMDAKILDQGSEGACVGFALAATINQLKRQGGDGVTVSARMLYEMARLHDEWPGEEYPGSSLRGGIRGWRNMGVCPEEDWVYENKKSAGQLTIERAKAARSHTVGAYYRVLPEISHFHAAINECGIIPVSAKVHSGWSAPGASGVIKRRKGDEGGHAFAIVGYDQNGFWIQNSWGTDWGMGGFAHWSYEDWIDNIMDAWVVRLALPTPQIFDKVPKGAILRSDDARESVGKATTPRSEIAGHFVHIDDGNYDNKGRYWSNHYDVEQTAKFVADSTDYDHLLIYAHGGLNAPKASAARIAAMKSGFKRNRVYPFHLMYDTGLGEELKDLVFHKGKASGERVGGFSDWSDKLLERSLSRIGTKVWGEMKKDADVAFDSKGAGTDSLKRFIKQLRRAAKSGRTKKIHLVGHSTGAIVIAHLLRALQSMDVKIASCSLLAPAVTIDLYKSHYLPILQGKRKLKLADLAIYNLSDSHEKDDTVTFAYRKSLLYLVSNSFENPTQKPLLGMQKFQSEVPKTKVTFHISNGPGFPITCSTSHGGFDNDPVTMNHVLSRVLGKKPGKPFTGEDLKEF